MPVKADVVSPEFALANGLPIPCSAFTLGTGLQMECHFYDAMQKVQQGVVDSFRFTVVTGLLNAMQFFTQQLAIDAAQWILNGGNGKGSQFYNKTFGSFLADAALGAANQFLSTMNQFTSKDFGFNLCLPPTLSLKLSLGLGKIETLPPPDCTFQRIAANYEQTYRSLDPESLAQNMKQLVGPGGNDISVNLAFNQKLLNTLFADRESNILQRQEGGGLKPVTDFISGKITTPANIVKDTLQSVNASKMTIDQKRDYLNSMSGVIFQLGLSQLPIVAASTFVNTLAVGLLQKFFNALNSTTDALQQANLTNPDAQANTGNVQPPTAITDILTPNLVTSEKQDFLYELSTCNTPRGTWGCSLDDGFSNALHSVSDAGGYTIARAAGIGTDGPVGGQVFLHKDWELIPEAETKDNQDPGCYQRAYCSSNLAKLRFARIISIGWELAANSPFNTKLNGKYITLERVVRNFNNCNAKGQIDDTHPWCHLINPGWVLTEPEFQCNIRGYGDSVIGSGSMSVRTQECQDVVSCLQRDDKGNCVGGFGYCLSERTVWRFGADSCDEKYVSCRTYATRDKSIVLTGANAQNTATGPQVSYVRNTVDYGSCNADTIGCQYYSALRDTNTSSTDVWVLDRPVATNLTASSSNSVYTDGNHSVSAPRVYFDATAKPCDASQEGCAKVYAMRVGQPALNLVPNGSFEQVQKNKPTLLTQWSDAANGVEVVSGKPYALTPFQPAVGDVSVDGAQGAVFPYTTPNLQDEAALHQRVVVAPLRNYVLSYYARKAEGAQAPVVQVSAYLYKQDGSNHVLFGKNYYRSSNCNNQGIYNVPANDLPSIYAKPASESWTRYTCEFVSNADAAYADIVIRGQNVAIDAVELEEGAQATDFVDGNNMSLPVDYLKIAPAELQCKGTNQDRQECSRYARACLQTEVGCQGYTDVGGVGGGEIPATLSQNDLCPNSCVGYAEYQKLPSSFDLTKNGANATLIDPEDQTLVNFIPKNAQLCTAASVGCEEFTNVEAATAGGEQKAYLSYARACQKPSDLTQTYFTWEGSDTTGYQLKTWSLIHDASVTPNPPTIIQKTGPDGIFKDPAACTAVAWKTGADPDCRQFYDEQGNVFYRYYSQTVVSSPDCRDYRKGQSSLADCSKTGGDFNQTTNECVYHILVAQSNSCSAAAAGCRAFIGTTGRNTASVYQESFTATTGTVFMTGDAQTKVSYSNEALLVGDHSLKVEPQTATALLSAQTVFPRVAGSLYSVSFWAKTTDAKHQSASISVDGAVVGTFAMETDWKRYEIGPFSTSSTTPTSTIRWVNLPAVTYLDQVNVQRLQDAVYVRNNTWTIPGVCDQTNTGLPLPQAMLGCREYRDRKGNVVDVREFSHLCRFESVGCAGFVNTQNSDDPYAQTFTLNGVGKTGKSWDNLYSGTVTTSRPGDQYMYLIDEPSAHCDSASASCRAFGLPILDENMRVTSTKTVYLLDDITQYVDGNGEPNLLCRPSELFCDRFVANGASGGAVTSYFRDPGKHVCEWHDKVALAGMSGQVNGQAYVIPPGVYSGWFVQGANPPMPCYPNKLAGGNTFLSEYAAAPGYQGWTDLCPGDQAECSEFRDPNDHTDISHPQGKPYFFIDNQRLDKRSCGGKVDLLSGCVLFRNLNDSVLTYSVSSTYAASHAADDAPVAPIDCQSDPNNPLCKGSGTCANVVLNSCGGLGCSPNPNSCGSDGCGPVFVQEHQGAACSTDADCSFASDAGNPDGFQASGTCQKNNANLILKVKLDRDCTTWLGCSSGETVYDTAQQKYVDLCTNLQACDKGLGTTGKNFCAHYVDRNPQAPVLKPGQGFYEPVLRQGVFLNATMYAGRPVGFGQPDYSSYALPNHFQIADYATRPVGYDLLVNRGNVKNQFVHDYRNVAVLPLTDAAQAIGTAYKFVDQQYPYLNLCKNVQTGLVGYYILNENPPRCYFALDAPYSQNVADLLGQGTGLNPRNAQNEANAFEQIDRPDLNQPLSEAYPPSECKAYPDQTAPFPNQYVKDWDFTKSPPKPQNFVDGYTGVPYCEYGESCSCSYRKVNYGGTTKYFSIYGTSAPEGVCMGGAHDGESCIPGGIDAGASNATSTVSADSSTPQSGNQFCGSNSTCQAIQSVSLVRGIYGQCLERDSSRIINGSQAYNPCLIWSPSPILTGQNDTYHYQPTAGYLPPQNSGEYYCTGNAIPPTILSAPAFVDPDADSGMQFWTPPGLTDTRYAKDRGNGFNYDDNYVSDGSCVGCAGDNGIFADGSTALNGDMGQQCQAAKGSERPRGVGAAAFSANKTALGNGYVALFDKMALHVANYNAGRWIQTGRGILNSYQEYFVTPIAPRIADWIVYGDALDHGQNLPAAAIEDAMMERNFSYFSFNVMPDTGNGLIGCGYSDNWVDGVSVDDYSDAGKLKSQSSAWLSAFNANFTHNLTPEGADYLRTADGKHLQKVPCDRSPSGCYYKFWELGYRAEGQPAFMTMWTNPVPFGAKQPFLHQTTTANKSYFAIRAVFEDTNEEDNKTPLNKQDPSGNQLSGPFRFIGFWITAAAPGVSEKAIYMTLDIGHADICKEVAQVISPDTRENAAFVGRVHANSTFSIPLLGVMRSTINPPFGSARNTGPIGITPLYQMRGLQPGAHSILRPATWISSGASFFRASEMPTANWAWITNLFAKVYRVYHYYDEPVGRSSWACVAGPRTGSWCPSLEDHLPGGMDASGKAIGRRYCGLVGTCNPNLVAPSQVTPLCNGLSGVNSGLSCSGSEDATGGAVGNYGTCHNAPVKSLPGATALQAQYTTCDLQSGWKAADDGVSFVPLNLTDDPDLHSEKHYIFVAASQQFSGKAQFNGKQAALLGALRCHSDGVKYPDGRPARCTVPTDGTFGVNSVSLECPKQVIPIHEGDPQNSSKGDYSWCKADADGVGRHCQNGYQQAACVTDNDCRFDWTVWWNNGTDRPAPYDLYSPPDYSSPSIQGVNWDMTNVDDIDPPISDTCKTAIEEAKNGLIPIGKNPCRFEIYSWLAGRRNGGTGSHFPYASHNGPDSEAQATTDFPLDGLAYGSTTLRYPESDIFMDTWRPGQTQVGSGIDSPYEMDSALWWAGPDLRDKAANGVDVFGTMATDTRGNTGNLDIGKKSLREGRYLLLKYSQMKDIPFPGSFRTGYPNQGNDGPSGNDGWITDHGSNGNLGTFIPGHCEAIAKKYEPDKKILVKDVTGNISGYDMYGWGFYDVPYYDWTPDPNFYIRDQNKQQPLDADSVVYAKDRKYQTQRYFVTDNGSPWSPGVCEYGVLDGKTCNSNDDCAPPNYDKNEQDNSWDYCQPVTNKNGQPNSGVLTAFNPDKSFSCVAGAGDANSNSLDADNNSCTHNAGYEPIASLCGKDPSRSQCLNAERHDLPLSYDPRQSPPPTDVTAGLYTPRYLNSSLNDDYSYIQYYTPRPPTVVAPDTKQTCPASGQCPIAALNTFSFENQAEGSVAYVGGQAIATIRFYAWTGDNQGPLKDMWIDWGDGNVQQLHEASMKNKKPFCGGTKECQFVPGLTCNADTDCPPAGGKCVDVGFCSASPATACQKDDDCNVGNTAGLSRDTCTIKTSFGNSSDACEPNYFQFTHAYSCGTLNEVKAGFKNSCQDTQGKEVKHCARDNSAVCTSNSDCYTGDTCIAGTAPPDGCFDVTRTACRFTPRILVKDSWGWCTGECRIHDAGGGKLNANFSGSGLASGYQNHILFPNGGCYDGTGRYLNTDTRTGFAVASKGTGDISNTCDPQSTGTPYRPWIIYQGALQLGVTP